MNKEIQKLIVAHAEEQFPKEACGFLFINQTGELKIRPCKNVSVEPNEEFEIEQDEYFDTLRNGKIVGVYHSGQDSAFSPSDIFHAEELSLPLYLYGTKEKRFLIFWPKSHRAEYLARPFIWGHYDCYTLIRDYYRTEYRIFLGEYDADASYERGRKQDIVVNFGREGFLQSSDLSNVKIGDVLLFECGLETHLGIYLGGNQFLHQPLNSQSRIELLDGYWAKNLKFVLKHKTRL